MLETISCTGGEVRRALDAAYTNACAQNQLGRFFWTMTKMFVIVSCTNILDKFRTPQVSELFVDFDKCTVEIRKVKEKLDSPIVSEPPVVGRNHQVSLGALLAFVVAGWFLGLASCLVLGSLVGPPSSPAETAGLYFVTAVIWGWIGIRWSWKTK